MLRRCRPLLGTFVEVSADREDAIEAAFAAIERVQVLMSAHDPESDVSRINRCAHRAMVEVDGWTMAVLRRAQFWSEQSDGAFDVVRAGKLALASGYLPQHDDQPKPQADRWTDLELEGDTARLAEPGCIDIGGIAKGFAVDKAVEALRSCGAGYGLVNAGGDLAGFGREWQASVRDGRNGRDIIELVVDGDAIATSAQLPDGGTTHLPRRDERYVSATVRAPSCIDADALTKVLVSGHESISQCLSLAGADGLLISECGAIEPVERLAA